jgi:hypothetical protein
MTSFVWFVALAIMLAAAYAWGYDNGQNMAGQLGADRVLELEKYKYDKFYELERWREERKAKHDNPDA